MDVARALKADYRDHPIDKNHFLYNEKLVHIDDFGIAGQSYYSRPNATIAEPIPGVEPRPLLRESVVKQLAAINTNLEDPRISEFFGGEVELYVEEGIRLVNVQKHLFEIAIPELLIHNNPSRTDKQVDMKKRTIIAEPSLDLDHPAPHETGGAFDAILRYKQLVPTFVDGTNVWIGHTDGDTAENIDPDYFENHEIQNELDAQALKNRRAFYAIMTGESFQNSTNLVVNPTEIWHWSTGDQLWGKLSGKPAYYRGVAE